MYCTISYENFFVDYSIGGRIRKDLSSFFEIRDKPRQKCSMMGTPAHWFLPYASSVNLWLFLDISQPTKMSNIVYKTT